MNRPLSCTISFRYALFLLGRCSKSRVLIVFLCSIMASTIFMTSSIRRALSLSLSLENASFRHCHRYFADRGPLASMHNDVSPVAQTQALQHGLRSGHAFDVFALHGVVPRFAIRQHPFFSEECLYNDFQVFRRSFRNACSSLSLAVGGARPYLRS